MTELLQLVSPILTGLVLAGVLWLLRITNETQRNVAVMASALETAKEEVNRLRGHYHEVSAQVQGIEGVEAFAVALVRALDSRYPLNQHHPERR